MFSPKILEKFQSQYSGELIIKKDFNNIYVTTGHLTQSGGLINEIWQSTFKKVKPPKNKSWLILGLATGTVAKIISQKYQPTQIVGIEIDPVMISIGKKYFALDKIPNLQIINQDANSYIVNHKSYFDFILVDLYLVDSLPAFIYNPKFLKKLKLLSSCVIINHLFYDPDKKSKAENLVKLLSSSFENIQLHRVLTNLMIICS